ncbi:MAG: PHP domain-containing protein [Methanocorpusculum sp.]|uniref:PHP domain-containing protein n=1 Tax=Methanocorpusculum sp. TaxID=2058474 RepID=UPI00271D9F92|nr:PHP domain-containing protein [Methanocorpusculum sp.]MDO9522730.1 PHP domain-containing protein [Methanocorpusculum sp.]
MVLITCDLHIHSSASADGKCPVAEVIAKAKERGLDAISITDHDTTEGAKQALAIKNPGILIIPGIEVSTKQGHVLVLGTTEMFEPGKDALETIREAKAQGCLTIIPHPYHRWRHAVGLHSPKALREADAIEVFNSRYYLGLANIRAAKFAKKYHIPMTAGSDAHTCQFVGYGINIIDAEERTVPSILEAIRNGKLESRCKKTPIRTYTSQSFHNVVRKARRQTSRLKPRRMR